MSPDRPSAPALWLAVVLLVLGWSTAGVSGSAVPGSSSAANATGEPTEGEASPEQAEDWGARPLLWASTLRWGGIPEPVSGTPGSGGIGPGAGVHGPIDVVRPQAGFLSHHSLPGSHLPIRQPPARGPPS